MVNQRRHRRLRRFDLHGRAQHLQPRPATLLSGELSQDVAVASLVRFPPKCREGRSERPAHFWHKVWLLWIMELQPCT